MLWYSHKHGFVPDADYALLTEKCAAKVRKTPRWPGRSWVNFSLLQLYSHRNTWANLRLLGQSNTFLAQVPLGPLFRGCHHQHAGRASPGC